MNYLLLQQVLERQHYLLKEAISSSNTVLITTFTEENEREIRKKVNKTQ